MFEWLFGEKTPKSVHQENIWAELDQQFRQGLLDQLYLFVRDELEQKQNEFLPLYANNVDLTQGETRAFIKKTQPIVSWDFPFIYPFVFEFDFSVIKDRLRRDWWNRWLSPPNQADVEKLNINNLSYISSIKKLKKISSAPIKTDGENPYLELAKKIENFLQHTIFNTSETTNKNNLHLASSYEMLKENRNQLIAEYKEVFSSHYAKNAQTPEHRLCLSMNSFISASDAVYVYLEARHQATMKDADEVLNQYKEKLASIWKELGLPPLSEGDDVYVMSDLRDVLRKRFPCANQGLDEVFLQENSVRQAYDGSDLRLSLISPRADNVSPQSAILSNIKTLIEQLYGNNVVRKYSSLQRVRHFFTRKKLDIYSDRKEPAGSIAREIVKRIEREELMNCAPARIQMLLSRWDSYLEVNRNTEKANLVAQIKTQLLLLENRSLNIVKEKLEQMDRGCIDGNQYKTKIYKQYAQATSIISAALKSIVVTEQAEMATEIDPLKLVQEARGKYPEPIDFVEKEQKQTENFVWTQGKKIISTWSAAEDLKRKYIRNKSKFHLAPTRVIYFLSLLQWFYDQKSNEIDKKTKGKSSDTIANYSACFSAVYIAQSKIISALEREDNAYSRGSTCAGEGISIDLDGWKNFEYYNEATHATGSAFKKLHQELMVNQSINEGNFGVRIFNRAEPKPQPEVHMAGSLLSSDRKTLNPNSFVASNMRDDLRQRDKHELTSSHRYEPVSQL